MFNTPHTHSTMSNTHLTAVAPNLQWVNLGVVCNLSSSDHCCEIKRPWREVQVNLQENGLRKCREPADRSETYWKEETGKKYPPLKPTLDISQGSNHRRGQSPPSAKPECPTCWGGYSTPVTSLHLSGGYSTPVTSLHLSGGYSTPVTSLHLSGGYSTPVTSLHLSGGYSTPVTSLHLSGGYSTPVTSLHLSGGYSTPVTSLHLSGGYPPTPVTSLHLSGGYPPTPVTSLHLSGGDPTPVTSLHLSGGDPTPVTSLHLSGGNPTPVTSLHLSGGNPTPVTSLHLSGGYSTPVTSPLFLTVTVVNTFLAGQAQIHQKYSSDPATWSSTTTHLQDFIDLCTYCKWGKNVLLN